MPHTKQHAVKKTVKAGQPYIPQTQPVTVRVASLPMPYAHLVRRYIEVRNGVEHLYKEVGHNGHHRLVDGKEFFCL